MKLGEVRQNRDSRPSVEAKPQRKANAAQTKRPAGRPEPELDAVVRDLWRTVGEHPAYLEDVPSDAVTNVLELVVQDAERKTAGERDPTAVFIYRCRYYARRLGTLLAESDRHSDTDDERLARIMADPYIARVTPELTHDQLTRAVASVSALAPRRGVDNLAELLAAGPPAELAVYKVRDALPLPEELSRFIKGPTAPLNADEIADGHRLFLVLGLVRAAPPTWDMTKILEVYNANVSAARGSIAARHMGPDELDLMLAQVPWVRDEYERIRFNFRSALKDAIAHAPTGQRLGDTIRDFCRYGKPANPGYELDVCDLIAHIRGDSELQRLLNERLATDLTGPHVTVLPRLARWMKRIYGDALPRFSVVEIADRMRDEDACFTPSLVAELFARCPEILGATPDADTRRNFMLAVTVANTMQRMWPGASHDDVVGLLAALGPHSAVPEGLTTKHVKLLEGYDFVPRWPNGMKPDAKAHSDAQHLGDLGRELSGPLSLLRGGMAEHVRAAAAELLASCAVPDSGRIKKMVADCFRPTCVSKLVALAEHHAPLDMNVVNHLISQVSEGRYDELVANPSWRTVFRRRTEGGVMEASVISEEIFKLVSQFRDGERSAASTIELAVFRKRAATAAMNNLDKIPQVLPITQQVVEHIKSGGGRPFENVRVVMIQHELGQAFPQVEAYRRLGMDPAKCIFVGKPYHPNASVEDALLKVAGVSGRFFERGDLEAMHKGARAAVDEAIAARRPGELVLIVGDGPGIRDYVEERYLRTSPELAKVVRFTEQTAIGHRAADLATINKRVVSYARTRQKIIEAPYIGRAGVNAIERVLTNLKDTLENKLVWVNGIGGPIGRATAEAFKAHGARVAGHDPAITDEHRAWAQKHGISIFDNDNNLPSDVFMVAGAAGARTINAAQIDRTRARADGGPTYYASFSSEYVELDREHLEKRATDVNGNLRKMVATMVNDQPTYYYWLDDGSVRAVMADGVPVNFQDVNSVAPEVIDATMALSVAAAAEACEDNALGFFSAQKYVGVVEDAFRDYLARSGTALHA